MQYPQNTGWLFILVLPQQVHMYTEYCKKYKVRNKTVLTNYWWLSFSSADKNVFFVVVFLTQSGRWLYREAPWNSKDERYIFVLGQRWRASRSDPRDLGWSSCILLLSTNLELRYKGPALCRHLCTWSIIALCLLVFRVVHRNVFRDSSLGVRGGFLKITRMA